MSSCALVHYHHPAATHHHPCGRSDQNTEVALLLCVAACYLGLSLRPTLRLVLPAEAQSAMSATPATDRGGAAPHPNARNGEAYHVVREMRV